MKDAFNWLFSGVDTAEERISELEFRQTGITPLKQAERKE